MDYRERYYFLINVKGSYHNDKIKMLKKIAPSLKLTTPINHYKSELLMDYQNTRSKCWNGTYFHMNYITHLASIRKEDYHLFMTFLKYMTGANAIYYKQVYKEDLKQ